MRRPVRSALVVLAKILVSAPLSMLVTILLLPLWEWLEAATGIESVGHSGPAEWCYLVVFLLLVACAVLGLSGWWRGERKGATTG